MDRLLITGGTGTFGKAYLAYGAWPGRIITYSRCEQRIEGLRALNLPNTRFFMGDVRDRERLRMALRGVQVVIHAAALKVVPGGSYNLDEMVKTNLVGTMNVFEEAIHAGVEKVLFISTDKGCEPTTSYGALKLLGEHMAAMMNDWSPDTDIASVRYGNVIDSRGSFTIKLANWQKGDPPLEITEEEMTRFWVTQRQAIRFVDFVLDKFQGGKVFVPKLPKRRLLDLVPEGAPYKLIGKRGLGEKTHETLVAEHELPFTEERQSHYVIHYPVPGFRLPDGAIAPSRAVTSDPTSDPGEGEL